MSKMERTEPKRVIPYTDKELPTLRKLLSDTVEPQWRKSTRLKLEPNRIMPYTLEVEPILM
jgi:hypothetical protein